MNRKAKTAFYDFDGILVCTTRAVSFSEIPLNAQKRSQKGTKIIRLALLFSWMIMKIMKIQWYYTVISLPMKTIGLWKSQKIIRLKW